MGHDQRFKEFLHAFLRDFLRLFLPDVENRLDFQNVEFLDTELFTDRLEGRPREADVVVKLDTRDGSPELVLIHVEVQLRPGQDFGARMFEYYSLLSSRYKLPVFPIALYLLARLGVEEYGDRGGPAGAGLAALMNRSASRDIEQLRVSLMWRVVQSELDDARQLILIDLIQTYFGLSGEQMARYQRLVSRKENRKVQEVELTWADKLLKQGEEKGIEKGREQGLEQGREAGLLEGKREALLRQLGAKFGPLPKGTTTRVESIDSVSELDDYLERILTARSLQEMGL